MINTIKCPQCGGQIPLSEVILNEVKEDLEAEIISKEKVKSEGEIKKYKERAEKAEQNELEVRKEKEELAEEKRKFELEKQRQLDQEREVIRTKALEEQSEKDKMAIKEKDEVIERLNKSVEEWQRKSNARSQQLQGEVQELDLEEALRRLFPTDEIEEIKKGELGGDVRQVVRTQRGTICGVILWESKRTKAWKEEWIGKLKEDTRRDKAHLGVIISEVLPRDFNKEIGEKNGVWLVTPRFVEPLANLLRKNLYAVAKEKAISFNKQSKAEELYDFVTGNEFIQQVERMVEIYLEMKSQVAKERASSERQWKQREMQIDRLLNGVSGIYGSMQGIAGSALPSVRILELES